MFQLNNIHKNKPVCIGAIPLLAVEIDRPPMQRAFCFMEQEIWKPIQDYEGLYEVSSKGRVRSLSRFVKCHKYSKRQISGTILKSFTVKNGYEIVQLMNRGKKFAVHRLVGQAFIPNPQNKPQINHINGVKTDNRVENLEWCTQSENMQHAYKVGLQLPKGMKLAEHSKARKIRVTKVSGEHVGDFDCIKLAAINLGLRYSSICRVLSGKRKKYNNMIFNYLSM